MKRVYVFPASHFPVRAPLLSTTVAFLVVDRVGAPGWAWGVIGTIYTIAWIAWGIGLWRQKGIPLPGYGEEQ